jgi:hypothetical protein
MFHVTRWLGHEITRCYYSTSKMNCVSSLIGENDNKKISNKIQGRSFNLHAQRCPIIRPQTMTLHIYISELAN